MKKFYLFVLAILQFQGVFASHVPFPPATVVRPDIIFSTTDIMVGLEPRQSCLLPSVNNQGQAHLAEFDGNNIKLTVIAVPFSPCVAIPVDNPDYLLYNIGKLPIGEYNVTVFWIFETPLPVPPNDPDIIPQQYGETITFRVSEPVTVPLFSFTGLFIFMTALLVFTLFSFKRKARATSLLILLIPCFSIQANNVFHIMLSTDPSAPTVDEVVAESAISPTPPILLLDSFLIAPPDKTEALVSNRVTGNLLNLINLNPDWSYSKLYRYLVLVYPEGIDVEATRATLLGDQYIDFVFAIEDDKSIIPISIPEEDAPDPTPIVLGVTDNYLTALNIISAWELSEGMGYIGALDVGIQTDHPAFRAFDDLGNYLGGNLLDAFYQVDIGEGDLNVDSREPTHTGGLIANEVCDLADGNNDNCVIT